MLKSVKEFYEHTTLLQVPSLTTVTYAVKDSERLVTLRAINMLIIKILIDPDESLVEEQTLMIFLYLIFNFRYVTSSKTLYMYT